MMTTVQAVQTVLAPSQMVPQPAQIASAPPSAVQPVVLSVAPSVPLTVVPPLQPKSHVPPQSPGRRQTHQSHFRAQQPIGRQSSNPQSGHNSTPDRHSPQYFKACTIRDLAIERWFRVLDERIDKKIENALNNNFSMQPYERFNSEPLFAPKIL